MNNRSEIRSKVNLPVISSLIMYTSISFVTIAIFRWLPIKEEYEYFLFWTFKASLLFILIKLIVSKFGESFTNFIGEVPNWSQLKDVLIILIIYFMIGVGAVAVQIFVESSIDHQTAIEKWNLVSPSVFASSDLHYKYPLAMLLLRALIVPAYEELFVRGLIMNRLRIIYSTVFAVIVSALIFGALHYNKGYFSAFISGIILALVAVKYSSLYIPIFLHGTWNGLTNFLQLKIGFLKSLDLERINDATYWWPEFALLIVGVISAYLYFGHWSTWDKLSITNK